MNTKNRKRIGFANQRRGSQNEIFILDKLKKNGWTVIPTAGSKSPIDIIAYNKRKKLWWGIQVKSTTGKMTFDMDELTAICYDLYMTPVLAYVKSKKPREAHFCMKKQGRFYHVFEDGSMNHPLGGDYDCIAFKSKISMQ